MSHKHFDDTGHDIANYGIDSGNPPMAYMPRLPQGQPQYVIYQSYPMGTNPVGMNYPHQYAPQMMVPIPIPVSRNQPRPESGNESASYGRELASSNRKSQDLDYFLNRSDKQKEHPYRSRSGSKSAGELSDSPERTHRSRSVSKSVDKGSSSSYKTEKFESKRRDMRPENPFRKRSSKSPSPKRTPENPFRKNRDRSRSRERFSDKLLKKLRSDSRDKIKVFDKTKKRQLSPPHMTSYRQSRSPHNKRSPDSTRRKRKRSKSPRRSSGSRNRHSSREKHKSSMTGRTRSPYQEERLSERRLYFPKTRSHSDKQLEKRHLSPEFSREKRHYNIPEEKLYHKDRREVSDQFHDEFHGEFRERTHHKEHRRSFDFALPNELGHVDYNTRRQRSRQSYSPVSDDRSDRDGVGLKIHVSNQGRWIENKAKLISSPSRKTRLVEDGIIVGSHDNELKIKSDRGRSKTKYLEDDVEVFYDGPKSSRDRRRSWDDTFEFEDVTEDVSDSDSFHSQTDYRDFRGANSSYSKDTYSVKSGNAERSRNIGFDESRSGAFVSERISVQNLCIDYNNNKNTCEMPCRYLHLCKFFILGICKYGESCNKNHDILSPEIFSMLRKQNPKIQRSKFVVDTVKEILCSRFNRNKQFLSLHLPETSVTVETVKRSPSVESIKSLSEESVASIDSFDARYYTADYSDVAKKSKFKTKEDKIDKSKGEKLLLNVPEKLDENSKDECVVVVNIDNDETNKEVEVKEAGCDDLKDKVESEICDSVANNENDNRSKTDTGNKDQTDTDEKIQTKSLKEVKNSPKIVIKKDDVKTKSSKDKTDKDISEQVKMAKRKLRTNVKTVVKGVVSKERTVVKDKGVTKGKGVVKDKAMAKEINVTKADVKSKDKTVLKEDKISHNVTKVEDERNDCKSTQKKQDDDSKCDKNSKSRSLSPVSVENIEDWDKLDRYDRVSEDGLSDEENVQAVIDEDLESISSNESSDEREKELDFGPDMIKKIAVPIGMNDPLVFSSSVKTGDVNTESQTPLENSQTVNLIVNPNTSNIQPTVFPPPPNFNVPPPVLPVPTLFPAGINQTQVSASLAQPLMVPAQPPFHPSFPNQGHLVPTIGGMTPSLMPGLLPNPMQLVPNIVPPSTSQPGPTVNHLPSPDVLKEVIGTLTKKQEINKNESEAKKVVETTKEIKDKKVNRVDTDLKEPMKALWQFPHKSLINMGMIEFVTETEAYKDEMVAEMVKLLVTIDLPYVTLKKLKAVLKEKVQINIKTPADLRKILELYPDNFQIIETVDSDDDSDDGEVKRNVQIKPRLKLGFCSKHGYLPFYVGRCDCQQLHLCKFYFLSSCPNKNCKFGHKLKTDHNINTLKHHRLHRMTGEEIMEFLRDIDCRNIETVPGVCKFYNSNMSKAIGCYKGDVTDYQDICHNLHLCFYYVKGKCFVKDCKRSHSIHDTQPYSLLQKYGLDPDEFGETKILDLIAQKTVDLKKRKEEKAEQFQNSRQTTPEVSQKVSVYHGGQSEGSTEFESNSSESKAQKKGKESKKLSVKFPSVCKFFNNPSGCKKKDWGASGFCLFLHVCQKYVNGMCRVGGKCKRPHSFFSGEPAGLITRYGIDLARLTEQEILDTLTDSKNALTELPMIGDDEDLEEEKEKVEKSMDEKKGVPSSTQSSANVQTSDSSVFVSTSQHFASHNIDEVLQHIMKERGNMK